MKPLRSPLHRLRQTHAPHVRLPSGEWRGSQDQDLHVLRGRDDQHREDREHAGQAQAEG